MKTDISEKQEITKNGKLDSGTISNFIIKPDNINSGKILRAVNLKANIFVTIKAGKLRKADIFKNDKREGEYLAYFKSGKIKEKKTLIKMEML